MTEETKNIAVSNAKPPSLYFKTAKRVVSALQKVSTIEYLWIRVSSLLVMSLISFLIVCIVEDATYVRRTYGSIYNLLKQPYNGENCYHTTWICTFKRIPLVTIQLETAESVQLSALESAIVSAIDAAFLLTRGKVAAISSIKTEYTPVVAKGQVSFWNGALSLVTYHIRRPCFLVGYTQGLSISTLTFPHCVPVNPWEDFPWFLMTQLLLPWCSRTAWHHGLIFGLTSFSCFHVFLHSIYTV